MHMLTCLKMSVTTKLMISPRTREGLNDFKYHNARQNKITVDPCNFDSFKLVLECVDFSNMR